MQYSIQKYDTIETKGRFIIEDLSTVKILLYRLAPYRYKNAIIFGKLMNSRGIEFSELSGPIIHQNGCLLNEKDQLPTNQLNKLKNCWYNIDSISSWFKYRNQTYSIHDDKFGFSEYTQFGFGQFNYFFRIYLPDEELLHGLPMASTVCRFSTLDNYLDTINLSKDNESFLSNPFVILTNVYSTKLLIGARDGMKNPIMIKQNYNLNSGETTIRTFSKCRPNEAEDLFILDLDPQRSSVKFDHRNKNYNIFESKKQIYV